MPDVRAGLQLGLLLLALPAQYFIMNYSSKPAQQNNLALKELVNTAQEYSTQLLSWKSWEKWCVDLIYLLKHPHRTNSSNPWAISKPASKDGGESPAVEVMHLDEPQGFFAHSVVPRSPRGTNVKFRVGQVISHKLGGYKGVIIGWDETAKAPKDWLAQMHPPGKEHWRRQPNYAILVDVRDRPQPQVTYVPQENLQVTRRVKVLHPDLDKYFDGFDGSQYIPRPALKELYPDD